ncbi:MAG: hypothetical protein AB7P24_07605 [Nitrospira sp.]|nr:hypothetical protein [Nitrospira sp. WS238]
MKRFGRIFNHRSIAVCAVAIYAVLVVLSAGCTLAHAEKIQAHHHHSGGKSSPQSVFCSWVCQATSDLVTVAQPPLAVAWIVVEPQVVAPDSRRLSSASPVLQPRAPPGSEFLRQG